MIKDFPLNNFFIRLGGMHTLINFVGAIVASFLPETLGCSLPETILESSEFGKDQKYLSWLWNPEKAKVTHEKEYHSSTRRKSIRALASARRASEAV